MYAVIFFLHQSITYTGYINFCSLTPLLQERYSWGSNVCTEFQCLHRVPMFTQSSNVCIEFQCLHRVPMFAQSSDVCCTCRVIFHMFHSISPSNISYPLILPSSLQVLFTHRFSDIHHWNDSDNILQIVREFIIVDFSWVVVYM